MSTSDTRDRLAEELSAPVGALGLDLEAVDLSSAGKRRVLRVAVDKDGGVTMDDIAEATRAVSTTLDAQGLMGERAYTLEVSSPGVDRPLTLPRHWRRNAGRLVTVTLARRATRSPAGSRRATTTRWSWTSTGPSQRVPYDDVRKAKIQIEFRKEQT